MDRKKWIYILSSFAVILLFIIVFISLQLNKPNQIIESLEKAVETGDPELLSELIVPDESKAEVNDDTIATIIDYLKENNSSFQVIKDELYSQIEDDHYSPTNQQISLIRDGKEWGIFSTYKLHVKTGHIKVSGQNDDDQVDIQVEGLEEQLTEKDNGTYGPVLPGNHDVTLTVQNMLGTMIDKRKVEVWGSDQISLVVDTNKLVSEDEKVTEDILVAIDIFNHDISEFVTSEFDLTTFTNTSASGAFSNDQTLLSTEFNNVREYVDEIQSQYEGAIVNLDALNINYFNEEWTAEVVALVSYNEKIKYRDEEEFQDFSYQSIRSYSLYFDPEKEQWLIYQVIDTEANGSEHENWELKEDMIIEDPPLLRWNRTNDYDHI